MQIGGYEVLGEVGRGGAGVVLKARGADGKVVAVKVLFQKGANASVDIERSALERSSRFQRERRMLLTLGLEQGFVPLLGAGEAAQGSYFVMPFLAGGTLRDRVKRGPLDVQDAIDVMVAVGTAVGRAHAIGIVHRDLKPENVLFSDDGTPLVADLGLAKHFNREALGASASIDFSKTGDFKGSSGYMAPEQMNDAKAVGPAADVFALGAMLYECLTGQGAFEGQNLVEVFGKIESGSYEAITTLRPEVPAWLERVVRKALAKAPDKRYPDGRAFADALLAGGPVRRGRGPLVLVVLALVAAVSGGAYWRITTATKATPPGPPGPTVEPTAPPKAPPPPPPLPAVRFPDECRGFVRTRRFRLANVLGSYEWRTGGPGSTLCVTPDGRHVLSGSGDHAIRLWDAESGHEVRHFAGHSSAIYSLSLSADGKRLLSSGLGENVKLWDVETGELIATLDEPEVTSCALSPDGRMALTGTNDRALRVWDLAEKRVVREYLGHKSGIANAVVYNAPGATRVLSVSTDKTLKVWALDQSEPLRSIDCDQGQLLAVAVTPDGKLALTAGVAPEVKVWSVETGELVRTLAGHEEPVRSVAVSPDGKEVLTSGFDGTTRLWELATGAPIHVMRGHRGKAFCATFSIDGKTAFTAGEDQTIRTWDLDTGSPAPRAADAHEGWVRSVAFSPDGQRAVSASFDGTVRTWDLATNRPLQVINVAIKPGQQAFTASFSPDGRALVTGDESGRVATWEAATGKELRSIQAHEAEVRVAAFLPGERLLSAGGDKVAKVWDRGGNLVTTLAGHEQAIVGAVLVGDAGRLVTASKDKTLRTWDLATGASLATLAGHEHEVHAVALLPDGRVASASVDGTVRIWTTSPAALQRTLTGHLGPIHAVASLGDLVASGGEDGVVKMWDPRSGEIVDELDLATSSGDFVLSLGASPDGRSLLVGTARGLVLRFERTGDR